MMYKWVFVLLLVPMPALADGLGDLFKEVVNAVIQDVDKNGQNGEPPPAPYISPLAIEEYEQTITTWGDCRGSLGWQPSVKATQQCGLKHLSQCIEWINSLPINSEGENALRKITQRGKCEIMNVGGDRDKYISTIKAKETDLKQARIIHEENDCHARLDAIQVAVGASSQINDLPEYCSTASEEFKSKWGSKSKQVAELEAEAKTKKLSGLINKYKKIVPATARFLSSDIIIQWGNSNYGPLIEFIDLAQNNPRSKAKYEIVEQSLVMRHRITDPVTGESSNLVYVFTPHPKLPPGKLFLSRLISENNSLGGLIKEQKEARAQDIGTTFAFVYAGMTKGRSK